MSDRQKQKQTLPPFVIFKKLLAGICFLLAAAMILMTLFGPAEKTPPSEGEQIAVWSFMVGLAVVGLWIWGGKDPDARH